MKYIEIGDFSIPYQGNIVETDVAVESLSGKMKVNVPKPSFDIVGLQMIQ